MARTTTTKPAKSDSGGAVALLRGLVTVALILAVVMAVVTFAKVLTSDRLVAPLELGVAPDAIDPGFPAGASIIEATAHVDVEAGFAYRLLWWLVTDARAIWAVAFLEILRRMLAKGAEPFTEENEARLRWLIGLSLAFASIDSLRPVASVAIQDASGFEGFEASWGFGSLFAALLLSALLEVWRHGVALRSEQDFTI